MNKEYDINLILKDEVFKENRKRTLERDALRSKKAKLREAKEWIKAIIQAPFVMALAYFFYCFMYAIGIIIGG